MDPDKDVKQELLSGSIRFHLWQNVFRVDFKCGAVSMLVLLLVAAAFLGGTLIAGVIFCFTESSGRLQLAFGALTLIGGAIAVWCAFFVEYQPNPTLRVR